MTMGRSLIMYEGKTYTKWIDQNGSLFFFLEESPDLDILGIKEGDIEVNNSMITNPLTNGRFRVIKDKILTHTFNNNKGIDTHSYLFDGRIIKETQSKDFKELVRGQIAYYDYICIPPPVFTSIITIFLFVYTRPQDIRLKSNEGLFE